jgi:hypothetical protein
VSFTISSQLQHINGRKSDLLIAKNNWKLKKVIFIFQLKAKTIMMGLIDKQHSRKTFHNNECRLVGRQEKKNNKFFFKLLKHIG